MKYCQNIFQCFNSDTHKMYYISHEVLTRLTVLYRAACIVQELAGCIGENRGYVELITVFDVVIKTKCTAIVHGQIAYFGHLYSFKKSLTGQSIVNLLEVI